MKDKQIEDKRYCKLHSIAGTESESENCPDCVREAMGTMECWKTQEHLKKCEKCCTQLKAETLEEGRLSVLEDFDSIMKADAFMGLNDDEWKAVQKFFRYNDEISGWKKELDN